MANILSITAADSGKILPLRAGVDGVTLDFIPDAHFTIGFRTEDTGSYTLTSSAAQIEQGDGTLSHSFTLGGARLLMAKLYFDTKRGAFVLGPGTSLASTGTSGTSGGTGGNGLPGAAATIAVGTVTSLAYGSTPTVINVGTSSAAVFNFGIPQGKPGLNGTGSGSGSGGWLPEVTLLPDSNGNYTPDGSLSNAFRIVLTAPGKLLNPVNFTSGQFRIMIVQGGVGGFVLTYDLGYGFVDALPPSLATAAGAINKLSSDLTEDASNNPVWITDVTPDKTYINGYGLVRPIARVVGNSTQFYMLANAAGTGAFNSVPNGGLTTGGNLAQNTVIIQRSGRSAEATGTIVDYNGGTYLIAGAPQSGADPRPLLQLGTTDFHEGPPRGANRPSYAKQLLGAEGGPAGGAGMTIEYRDLRVTGARNDDGDARGIGQNGQATVTLNNVEITDCCNGILTDNATNTPLTINNSLIDRCGVGMPNTNANQGYNSAGYVHGIYVGHNNQTITINHTTFSNTLTGHDIKCRGAVLILNGVQSGSSLEGCAIDAPNGGVIHATDCDFHKLSNNTQDALVRIGNVFAPGPGSQEGIDTSRPREYIFTNCNFDNGLSAAAVTSFVCSKDPNVKVQFIDCTFANPDIYAKNTTTPQSGGDPFYEGMLMKNGVYYMPGCEPIWTNTGGPQGPRIAPGRPANIAMTALPG